MASECLKVYLTACRLAMMRTSVNFTDNSRTKLKSDGGGGAPTSPSCYTEMYTVLSTLRNFLSCGKCGQLASDAVKLSPCNGQANKEDNNNRCEGEIKVENDEGSTENGADCSSREAAAGEPDEQWPVICFGCTERLTMKVAQPHSQIRTLVQCYVKLCQYLQNTRFCNRNTATNGGAASSRAQRDLTQLILEGASFRDIGGEGGGGGGVTDSLLSKILSEPPTSGGGGGVKRGLADQTAAPDAKSRRHCNNNNNRKQQGKTNRVRNSKGGETNGGGGERKGCQCGHSTPRTGSSLTCFGQRCPCYSNGLACVNCKCRGCKNPKKYSAAAAAGTTDVIVNETLENFASSYSASSSTTSSTISSSCSSSPHPEDNLG